LEAEVFELEVLELDVLLLELLFVVQPDTAITKQITKINRPI
jgi:hypothetical protein